MNAAAPRDIQVFKAFFDRRLAAYCAAANDRTALFQFGSELNAGIAKGFTRGDHGKLRAAINLIFAAALEIL